MSFHWTILESVFICTSHIQMSLKQRILLTPTKSAPLLPYLHLEIDNMGRLKRRHYDKSDDFNLPLSPIVILQQHPCTGRALHNSYVILGLVSNTEIFCSESHLEQRLLKQGYDELSWKYSTVPITNGDEFVPFHVYFFLSLTSYRLDHIVSPENVL